MLAKVQNIRWKSGRISVDCIEVCLKDLAKALQKFQAEHPANNEQIIPRCCSYNYLKILPNCTRHGGSPFLVKFWTITRTITDSLIVLAIAWLLISRIWVSYKNSLFLFIRKCKSQLAAQKLLRNIVTRHHCKDEVGSQNYDHTQICEIILLN